MLQVSLWRKSFHSSFFIFALVFVSKVPYVWRIADILVSSFTFFFFLHLFLICSRLAFCIIIPFSPALLPFLLFPRYSPFFDFFFEIYAFLLIVPYKYLHAGTYSGTRYKLLYTVTEWSLVYLMCVVP